MIITMDNNQTQTTIGRKLLMWLGSFVVIGTILAHYVNMPLTPIIAGGVGTLVVTVLRHYLLKR